MVQEKFNAMADDGNLGKYLRSLPSGACQALLVRFAERFLPIYVSSRAEPRVQRDLVAQAFELVRCYLAETHENGVETAIQIGEQFFDHHDVDAIRASLHHILAAALNTASETKQEEDDQFVAIQSLVAQLCDVAFDDDAQVRSVALENAIEHSEHLLNLVGDSDIAQVTDAIQNDIRHIENLATEEQRHGKVGIPTNFFGELWRDGQPTTWPPLELRFRPRARLIRTIGDRLISGPEAAVIELVKNSHDADATQVTIAFFPSDNGEDARIEISDDGHGMTLEDIRSKWMEPATTDKRERTQSPAGRKLLGSKGIGRFAASRLGASLQLRSIAHERSTSNADSSRYQLTKIDNVDWDNFDTVEYLDEVRLRVTSGPTSEPTGTVLRISRLRDDWTETQVRLLHYELRRLLSPIPDEDSQFCIRIDLTRCSKANSGFDGLELLNELSDSPDAPDVPQPNQIVRPFPLLDSADYSIDGIFDESGTFSGTMTISRGGLEPEDVTLKVPVAVTDETQCGIVLVKLSIFDRESEAVRQTAIKAGLGKQVGVREARKLIDSICGVALYRGGFRLRPYGDPDNDWLLLDKKRVQNPSQKVGHNQISGIVCVDDEATSGLIERSSREGLEENASFRRLTRLMSTLLSEVVEPRRRLFRTKAGIETNKGVRFSEGYKRSELRWSAELLRRIPEPERSAAEEIVAKESGELTAYLRRLEKHQALLEARVTAGQIVGEVMHQGNTPLAFIEHESERLERWWPSILSDPVNAKAKWEQVPSILNGLQASGGKLRKLFDALKPLSGARRGRPRGFDVIASLDTTLFLFRGRLEQLSIDAQIQFSGDACVAYGFEADLSTAVTNLVDNAIYWLEHHKVPNPRIEITVVQDDDEVVVHVEDNGEGIPAEFVEHVFDVGFSLKPSGTGLGLSIAREAIERSNGSLSYAAGDRGGHFVVTLALPPSDIQLVSE